MKEVKPFKTAAEALEVLDNGGRFYNFFTDAKDGEIEKAELAKAAGVFSSEQSIFLFLSMALERMEIKDADKVIRSLSSDMRSKFKKYRPPFYSPSHAVRRGRVNYSAIVSGIPKFVKSNTDFNGFIMIPITSGNTTTFTMIPIIDQYDVYEVRDLEGGQDFLIAHLRGAAKIPEVPMSFGGVFRKLQGKNGGSSKHSMFLEAIYYNFK